jgi:hypothetical protein
VVGKCDQEGSTVDRTRVQVVQTCAKISELIKDFELYQYQQELYEVFYTAIEIEGGEIVQLEEICK